MSLLTKTLFTFVGQTSDSTADVNTDSLVDLEGEKIVYLGLVLLIAIMVIGIGALNRQLQNAILFALFLSAFLIAIIPVV
ncbi:MAG: hypothetical protein IGR76_16655 [Synechococcales cyanobacterium T60_A2020_003]|nr:hypothetical protein [Synechococcales cyanobacterium T60_A2020_003]